MSDTTSKPKGHGHQQSVADAATLFGSGTDDPFAAILNPDLAAIDENAEDGVKESTVIPEEGEEGGEADLETPKVTSSAPLPNLLETPASNTIGKNDIPPSTSSLFDSSSPSALFAATDTSDDWLHQTNPSETPTYSADEHNLNYNDNNGYDAQYGEQQQYYGEHQHYNEHAQPPSEFYGSTGYPQQENIYQQNSSYPANPYSEQPQYGEQLSNANYYGDQPSNANYYGEGQPGNADYYGEQQPGDADYYGEGQHYNEQQSPPPADYYGSTGYPQQESAYQQNASYLADPYSEQPQYGEQPNNADYYDNNAEHSEQQQSSETYQENQYQPKQNDEQYSDNQYYDNNQYGEQYQYDQNGQDGVVPQVNEATEHSTNYDVVPQTQLGEGEAAEPYSQVLSPYAPLPPGSPAGDTYQSRSVTQESAGDAAEDKQTANIPLASFSNDNKPFTQQHYNEQQQPPPPSEYYGSTGYPQQENIYQQNSSYPAEPYIEEPQYGEQPNNADYYGNNADHSEQQQSSEIYQENQYQPKQHDEQYGDNHYYDNNQYGEQYQYGPSELVPQVHEATDYFTNAAGVVPQTQVREGGDVDPYSQAFSPYAPLPPGSNLATPAGDSYHSRSATQEHAGDAAEERRTAKIPLASFSIDGKLLTFFPTWPQDAGEDSFGGGGGGYPLGRSGVPTKVTLRPLRSLIPPTSYASSKNPLDFPGPALESGSSQGSALSRATGTNAAANKAKKASLIKYLSEASTEMSSGIGYMTAGKHASEAKRTQDRILLLRLLVLLLEHDGNLNNNAAFDLAARELLLASDDLVTKNEGTTSTLDREPIPGASAEQKSNFLDQIEQLLISGQRKEAVDVAVREKMWTHAVVIASGMDVATWREVVGQFMMSEFEENGKSHQGVKVAYNLFSGQEPKATYDLFLSKNSSLPTDEAHGMESADAIKEATHSQWRKSVATILANRSNGDSATMTAIGDGLKMSGWIEASHVCYLLSPHTSPMEGYDGASTRMTLLGAHSPEASTSYVRDLDHIILTEVFEFALSLQPIAKGAEAYHGLAFLQPYRLLHAYLLAEMGDIKQAIRYCDSIMTVLKNGKMNRYYHPILLSQLQELSNRLQGDTKNVKWMQRKPTMDGVWGALEGRFSKFIAGEDDNTKSALTANKGSTNSVVGPFSHYSAITPDATSGGVSRVQSNADFRGGGLTTSSSRPHSRPGSAADFSMRSGISPLTNNFRTASEQGYGEYSSSIRDSSGLSSPKQSIGQQSSSDAEVYSGPYTTYPANGSPWYGQDEMDPEGGVQREGTTPTDSAYYGYQPHGASQSQFVSNVEEDLSTAMNKASIDEPIDVLGNAPTPGFTSNNNYAAPSNSTNGVMYDEDEEDLGFGNKSSRPKTEIQTDGDRNGSGNEKRGEASSTAEKKTESEGKPGELKQASSWFGRFWKKDSSGDAGSEAKAKKAHLGEEVSFYYDKDLKRWINKKAGDAEPAASTPPPPPRAQTASPSVMGGGMPSSLADAGPRRYASESRPPPPSSSGSGLSMNLQERGTPPISEAGELDSNDGSSLSRPPTVGRLRSNLADHSQPPALQPSQQQMPTRPSTSTSEGGPPRSVSASGPAKKKPISKRYVRVD